MHLQPLDKGVCQKHRYHNITASRLIQKMKRKGFEAEDHTKNIIKNMVKEKKIPNELLLELRKKVLSRLLNKSNGIMI